MRRRPRVSAVEPPARLRVFEVAQWLPPADGYDPDTHRGRRDGAPHGEPSPGVAAWRRQEAERAWTRARLAWRAEHGWPGMGALDLLRETLAIRRASRD